MISYWTYVIFLFLVNFWSNFLWFLLTKKVYLKRTLQPFISFRKSLSLSLVSLLVFVKFTCRTCFALQSLWLVKILNLCVVYFADKTKLANENCIGFMSCLVRNATWLNGLICLTKFQNFALYSRSFHYVVIKLNLSILKTHTPSHKTEKNWNTCC